MQENLTCNMAMEAAEEMSCFDICMVNMNPSILHLCELQERIQGQGIEVLEGYIYMSCFRREMSCFDRDQ